MNKICISILAILVALIGTVSAELQWSVQTVDSSDHVGSKNSITVDLDGNPYIVYRSDPNNGYLKYAKWTGNAWFVDYMAQKGDEPSTIADSSGNAHVSYRDFNSHDVIHARWNGNGWDKEIVDSAGAVGSFSSIAIDSHGYPHITYYDETDGNGDLKYAKWTGTGWDIQTVRGSLDYDEGRGTSIVIDSSDNPHIVFVDFTTGGAATNFNLKYTRWTGTGWNNPQIIESGLLNGPNPSLAIDRFNNLHLVYGSQGSLKYARLINNEWNIEVIESNVGSEGNRRLAVDSIGNPHVSYFSYDSYPYSIKYAKRTDNGWNKQIIESLNSGGGSTSTTIDSDRNVHISYYNAVNYNLKYAKGTPTNNPPVAEAGGPYVINEGYPVTLDGSGSSDPDGDPLTYAWDINNDGIYETPGMITTITPQDGPVEITVGLQVLDGKGGIGTDTATITVNNVPPEVGPITINPPEPIVDTEITATSPISDKGILDIHTVTWNWGDGTISPGTINSGIASGNHIYTTNDTFHMTLTVTDNDGGSTTSEQDVEVKKPCKCEKITIIPKTSMQGKTMILDAIVTGSKNQSTSPVSWDAIIDINWDITIKCAEGDGECSADLEPTKPTSTWDVTGKGGTVLSESHTVADGSATITCKAPCGKEQKTTVTTTYKATIQKGSGNQGDITGTVTGNIELGLKSKNPDCPGEWKMKLKYVANTKKDTVVIDSAGSDYDGDGKVNNVDKYPLDPSRYR